MLLTYLSGATTALRSWPASGVSETAHGLAPSSDVLLMLSIMKLRLEQSIDFDVIFNSSIYHLALLMPSKSVKFS